MGLLNRWLKRLSGSETQGPDGPVPADGPATAAEPAAAPEPEPEVDEEQQLLDDIRAGELLAARDLDPALAPAEVRMGATAYRVVDCYCLAPYCECTAVRLEFLMGADAPAYETAETIEPVLALAIDYDYAAHVPSTVEALLSKKDRKELWRLFKNHCAEFLRGCPARHAALRDRARELLAARGLLEPAPSPEPVPAEAAAAEPEEEGGLAARPTAEDVEKVVPVEPIPSLVAAAETAKVDLDKARQVFAKTEDDKPAPGRDVVFFSDGEHAAAWEAPALAELFRETSAHPGEDEGGIIPLRLMPFIWAAEQALLLGATEDTIPGPPPTDQEILDLLGVLRRRPDGASTGPLHDLVRQGLCLSLARHPLNRADYDLTLRMLARLVRRARQGPSSRNYVTWLREIAAG